MNAVLAATAIPHITASITSSFACGFLFSNARKMESSCKGSAEGSRHNNCGPNTATAQMVTGNKTKATRNDTSVRFENFLLGCVAFSSFFSSWILFSPFMPISTFPSLSVRHNCPAKAIRRIPAEGYGNVSTAPDPARPVHTMQSHPHWSPHSGKYACSCDWPPLYKKLFCAKKSAGAC